MACLSIVNLAYLAFSLYACQSNHACLPVCADSMYAVCFQRGEFVPRQLSASSQDSVAGDRQARLPYSRGHLAKSNPRAGQIGSRLMKDGAGRGHTSLISGHSNKAGHFVREAGQGSNEAEVSRAREGQNGRQAGQGSEEAGQFSSCTSSHTEQSSNGIEYCNNRARQSPAPLHLRESIQGLLNPQPGASQASSMPFVSSPNLFRGRAKCLIHSSINWLMSAVEALHPNCLTMAIVPHCLIHSPLLRTCMLTYCTPRC